MFRFLATLISLLFFLFIVGIALSVFLVFSGTPESCVDREVHPAPPPSIELQENWRRMRALVEDGETVSLGVTELQASSYGREYLEDKDVPLDDFVMHFCPDKTAEASGRVSVLGLDSNLLVRGRLDVSGDKPRVRLDSFRAGNFPSFVAKRAVQLLLDEDDVRTLDLFDNIVDVEYRDGEVVVTVEP